MKDLLKLLQKIEWCSFFASQWQYIPQSAVYRQVERYVVRYVTFPGVGYKQNVLFRERKFQSNYCHKGCICN